MNVKFIIGYHNDFAKRFIIKTIFSVIIRGTSKASDFLINCKHESA